MLRPSPCKPLCGHLLSFIWGKYPPVEPLGHREGECISLLGTAPGFPEGCTPLSGFLQLPSGGPSPSILKPSIFLHSKSWLRHSLAHKALKAAPAFRGEVQTWQCGRALPNQPCLSPQLCLWPSLTLNLTFQPYRRPTAPRMHVISVLHGLSSLPGAHTPPSPSLSSKISLEHLATCWHLPGPDCLPGPPSPVSFAPPLLGLF